MTPRPRLPLLLLGCVAASLATRWLSLCVDLLDVDESVHVLGAWALRRGETLYRDFADNKPPLLHVFYLLLLGFGDSLRGVHLGVALVVVPLTAFGVSAFFDHSRRGRVAAGLFLVYSAAYLAHDMLAAHSELLLLLPAVWALVLVRDPAGAAQPARLFGAGALLGLATLIKHPAALFLAAPALAAWRAQAAPAARLRGLASVAAGFALPLAATYAWFARLGAADELVDWTLLANFVYAQNPISAGEALGRAAAVVPAFALATAPLAWGAWRAWADRDHAASVARAALLFALPAPWLGARFFPHYFVQLYLPLALCAASWAERVLAERGGTARRVLIAHAAGILLLSQAVNAWLYLGPARVYRERDRVYARVAERLASDPCAPAGTLFVWGWAPTFYYTTRLPPATRFVALGQARLTGYVSGNLGSLDAPPGAAGEVSAHHWDLLLADLDRRGATYVLDTAPAGLYRWDRYPLESQPRLFAYVRERFERLDDVDRVRIWRRRGCEAAR